LDKWDEVRTAYQVARMGTVSGAADVLGFIMRRSSAISIQSKRGWA